MNRFAHWGRNILITLILVWGILALTIRLTTPLLEHAREPIAEWLSTKVGQPVHFERIQASWWGIGPRLQLHQVRIGSGDHPIALQSVSIDLSHISLLQGRLLDALRLTLDGLKLNLVREADRRVHLEGVPSGKTGDGQLPLPRHLRLRHTRLHIEDRFRAAAPINIDALKLDLVRHGQDLRLRGSLDSTLGKARFSARIEGFLGSEDWQGSSYLKVQGLDLRRLLSDYLPDRYRLNDGRLELEIWQNWAHATEVDARGHVAITELKLARLDQSSPQFQAAMLSSDIDYQRHSANEWRIAADNLILKSTSGIQPLRGQLALQQSMPQQNRHFEIAATNLPLDVLRDLAQILPLDQKLAVALAGLQPRGLVQSLRLSLSMGDDTRWAVDTRLLNLGITPWQAIPGVNGLNTRVTATPLLASIQLDGTDMQIDYRQLFREPHSLRRLNGNMYWQRQEDNWTLFSDDLDLVAPELTAKAWFEYRKAGDLPAVLDLHGRIRDGDAAATSSYLPAAIMSDELVTWLDRSLSTGHVEQADVLVSGPLHDFPFHRTHNGVFEVVGRTRDTALDYQTGWPPLSDVGARLFFHQNSLDIDLTKGRIYDSEITSAHAHLDSLGPTSPLRVQSRVKGPLADDIRLLSEPALRSRFGHIAKALTTTGGAELALQFQVPLRHGQGGYQLDGRLHFKNNRMRLRDWDLTIDKIRGELGFSLDALQAKAIEGVAFGSPIKLDVLPVDGATRISARANWPIKVLQQRFPKLPLQLASGAADFNVNLDITGAEAAKDRPTTIEVASKLKGMRLDLPYPLGKTPEQAREIRVSMPLGSPGGPLHIHYGENFDARLNADGDRGEIRYARGNSLLPDKPGYRVLASVPRVNIREWQQLAERLGAGNGAASWRLELATPTLALDDLELADVKLKAQGESDMFDSDIDSPRISGDLHFRSGKQDVLTANLKRLYLTFDTGDGPSSPPPDPHKGPDPRELPQVDLQCADLRLNKASLGRLRLAMQPAGMGSRISELSIRGPSGTLQASASWLWKNSAAQTRASGHMQLPDLGALLSSLGYPRQMHDARADLHFTLDWPGHPGQLHRATLHGSADLQLSDGRLSEVDPGIARVLGLLSLDALQRRLKFDFGDLLKKGYSFDSIKGHFELADGQARTRDLVVDGPSGRIEIGGRIGLVARDFDQVVQVAPKLDATLVIASTVAGGPVAGAATFLAQRLFAEEVDKINRFEYAVTGSWDDPKITPLKSGGPVSQILNTLSGKKSETKTKAQEKAIDETKTRPKKGFLEKLLGKPKKTRETDLSPEAALPGAE